MKTVSIEWQGGEWSMGYEWEGGVCVEYFEHNGFRDAEPPMVVEDLLVSAAYAERQPSVDDYLE